MIETSRARTTLVEIRGFLHLHGADSAPPPWSTPEHAVDALYHLLRDRRGDERFWDELADLAERLDDRGIDRESLGKIEVLRDATIGDLIHDLRRELGKGGPDADSAPSLRRWIRSSISASALAAFLLLGTATGCNEEDAEVTDDAGDFDGGEEADLPDADVADEADGGEEADLPDADVADEADGDEDGFVDELCEEAVDGDLEGEDGTIYCELLDIIGDADITTSERSMLLDCLPWLGAEYRAQLLEDFQTLSDEELVDRLEQMTDYGAVCGEEDAH